MIFKFVILMIFLNRFSSLTHIYGQMVMLLFHYNGLFKQKGLMILIRTLQYLMSSKTQVISYISNLQTKSLERALHDTSTLTPWNQQVPIIPAYLKPPQHNKSTNIRRPSVLDKPKPKRLSSAMKTVCTGKLLPCQLSQFQIKRPKTQCSPIRTTVTQRPKSIAQIKCRRKMSSCLLQKNLDFNVVRRQPMPYPPTCNIFYFKGKTPGIQDRYKNIKLLRDAAHKLEVVERLATHY